MEERKEGNGTKAGMWSGTYEEESNLKGTEGECWGVTEEGVPSMENKNGQEEVQGSGRQRGRKGRGGGRVSEIERCREQAKGLFEKVICSTRKIHHNRLPAIDGSAYSRNK